MFKDSNGALKQIGKLFWKMIEIQIVLKGWKYVTQKLSK